MTIPNRNALGHPNRREALFALVGAALLPACGGGTDVAGISSGGTGSFTTGVIVGLGSVIVNGIRYDDDAANISFNGASATAAALQLGMVVRIRGSAVTPATTAGALATATASSIACGSEWKGPVSEVDVSGNTFQLLGQTVHVLASTVFSGGLFNGDLKNGGYAEVYGFIDPTDGSLQASRVEIEDSAPDRYQLSGLVKDLDTTTFQLGSALINHAAAAKSASLQNGQLVRVELDPAQVDGAWVATEVKVEDYSDELDDEDEAEIEGTVTAFTSPTAFSVNGIPVDASQTPTSLALGVRVEVKGSIRNGVVIASEIEIEDEDELDAQEFEFHGSVSELDTVAKTFVIRDYTVRYDDSAKTSATQFDLGGATWANGLFVEVKAVIDNSGQLLATRIEVDD